MINKVLILDNHGESDKSIDIIKVSIKKAFNDTEIVVCDNVIDFKPDSIFKSRPDILIIDVALKENEEKLFKSIEMCKTDYNINDISGIRYCRQVKSFFEDLPVILISTFFRVEVLSAAFNAGADGFLCKKNLNYESVISTIQTAFIKNRTSESGFYTSLRSFFVKENKWERDKILRAFDVFFSHGSGQRRLSALWSNLFSIIGMKFSLDPLNELIDFFVDNESLLLAANPRVRDHARHSGNVFWMGYYLINKTCIFDNHQKKNENPQYLKGSSMNLKFHLNYVWILTSFFHDIGYLYSRLPDLENRIKSIKVFFGETIFNQQNENKDKNSVSLEQIAQYLNKFGNAGSLLNNALEKVKKHSMQINQSQIGLEDHGILSAILFLDKVKKMISGNYYPELLHAATAIAIHNLPKWNKNIFSPNEQIKFPNTILPIAWLLMYCDELQNWGREPENDPFNVSKSTEKNNKNAQKKGYIGSRLIDFKLTPNNDDKIVIPFELSIEIQHFLTMHEGDTKEIVEDREKEILNWKTNLATSFRETLELDSFIQTTVTHYLPSVPFEPIVLKIDSREDTID